MAQPDMANAATAETVNGVRDFEQFGGPLESEHTHTFKSATAHVGGDCRRAQRRSAQDG
jgi:hypothetical protein